VVRAGLEGDVGSSTASAGAGFAQGHDFGVAFTRALGVAGADQSPVRRNKQAPDPGIRVGEPDRALCERACVRAKRVTSHSIAIEVASSVGSVGLKAGVPG